MVGGGVIEELWATKFIILIGSKRVTLLLVGMWRM